MTDLIQRKLEMIMAGDTESPITQPGEHPPCFPSLAAFREWCDAWEFGEQTGAHLPERKVWPGEPNYCHDCSSRYRNKMRGAGKCLFPGTVFVTDGEGEDEEEIGVEDA